MPVQHLAVDADTVEPDTSVRDAAAEMAERGIGDVVVAEGGEPVGMLTDRDVAVAYGEGRDLDSSTVADLMTRDVATIRASAEAVELPKQMAESRVRRMPVVDESGELVGIATLDDVVATVGEELVDVATVIEAQSPDYSP